MRIRFFSRLALLTLPKFWKGTGEGTAREWTRFDLYRKADDAPTSDGSSNIPRTPCGTSSRKTQVDRTKSEDHSAFILAVSGPEKIRASVQGGLPCNESFF